MYIIRAKGCVILDITILSKFKKKSDFKENDKENYLYFVKKISYYLIIILYFVILLLFIIILFVLFLSSLLHLLFIHFIEKYGYLYHKS